MDTVELYDLETMTVFGLLQQYGDRLIDFTKPIFVESIKEGERYLIKNQSSTFWLNMADVNHPLTCANIK